MYRRVYKAVPTFPLPCRKVTARAKTSGACDTNPRLLQGGLDEADEPSLPLDCLRCLRPLGLSSPLRAPVPPCKAVRGPMDYRRPYRVSTSAKQAKPESNRYAATCVAHTTNPCRSWSRRVGQRRERATLQVSFSPDHDPWYLHQPYRTPEGSRTPTVSRPNAFEASAYAISATEALNKFAVSHCPQEVCDWLALALARLPTVPAKTGPLSSCAIQITLC